MERTMSVEDKIRRAEEIYNRRRENSIRYNTAKVNVNNKKDYKLFKKMILQIIICLSIYGVFYFIINNNYVFSEDLRNKINEILSYDMNFNQIYNNVLNTYNGLISNDNNKENQGIENKPVESKEENNTQEQNVTELTENQNEVKEETSKVEENIGGAVENNDKDEGTTENKETEKVVLTQEEQDVLNIKNNISFIVPVQGYVSSKFGLRNPTTSTVPKNHTGLDIAAVSGTVIKSATDGIVSVASSEGDYGNHLKIVNGGVTIVYAHCKTLYVKQGENVKQGQKIAEVGSTGNSTGPHLHFEIRKDGRFVDPQKIIDI